VNGEAVARDPSEVVRWYSRPAGLLAVGGTLLALTALSYALSRLHLGSMGLGVALFIAVSKWALIALFFMHLVEQRGTNALMFGMAVVFVLVLLTFVLLETATRFGPTLPGA
jgi:cytochrome c oxidase subunit 4